MLELALKACSVSPDPCHCDRHVNPHAKVFLSVSSGDHLALCVPVSLGVPLTAQLHEGNRRVFEALDAMRPERD